MPSVSAKTTAKVRDYSGDTGAGNTSLEVAPANGQRTFLFIQNLSNADMWIRFGAHGAADTPGCIKMPASTTTPLRFDGSFVPSDSVNLFCVGSTKNFTILEG